MAAAIWLRTADVGRERAKAFFAARGESLKVQLIDEKTEGQSQVSCLRHQGIRTRSLTSERVSNVHVDVAEPHAQRTCPDP